MNKIVLMVSLSCALLISCSPALKKRPGQSFDQNPVIAILPFANESNFIEAPEKVRQEFFQMMQSKGYTLMNVSEIDSALKEMGITDGGQLPALTVTQIREKIPAVFFCYGTVIEYAFKSALAFSQRKVEIRLRLVRAENEQTIWEKQEAGIISRAGTEAAGDLVLYTGGKIVKGVKEGVKKMLPGEKIKKTADVTDAIADVDLMAELRQAIQKLLNQFPLKP